MKHSNSVKVRVCETDALGHISNISYFIYLEEARVEFFRQLSSGDVKEEWNIILAHTECNFVNQGYFEDVLTVETYVERVGNSSVQLIHDIYNQNRQLIAKGKATVVYFDFEQQRSKPLSTEIREKLNQFAISTLS
ncbi:acyl-CoA thioesterase [Alkalihalobacterium alkalinitrilicum]|uniref:acyl-CoA thioesterase n=1 Tax=Alkalihalobacterium alkalinitrilicum TaxID=427920 RepID=UPI0009951108|nr:thioesterase family protein [Alkalihalobacterium alkalinitrilicum]